MRHRDPDLKQKKSIQVRWLFVNTHVVIEIRLSILFDFSIPHESCTSIGPEDSECGGAVDVDLPDQGKSNRPSHHSKKQGGPARASET